MSKSSLISGFLFLSNYYILPLIARISSSTLYMSFIHQRLQSTFRCHTFNTAHSLFYKINFVIFPNYFLNILTIVPFIYLFQVNLSQIWQSTACSTILSCCWPHWFRSSKRQLYSWVASCLIRYYRLVGRNKECCNIRCFTLITSHIF